MHNPIIPFDFDGNAVRAIKNEQDAPWFVAKDVCDILELSNPTEALKGLDEDEKSTLRITEGTSQLGGNPNKNIISESGLYSLIFRSRKPEAKRFRKWVTSEVLPALRKHGRYEMPNNERPPVLPGVRLKSSLRAAAMHEAVQVAKLSSGSEEDVDRLYEKYCGLFAARPTPVGRPVSARISSGEDAPAGLLQEWMDTFIEEAPFAEKVMATELYLSFRAYCKERGLRRPYSQKWFGARFNNYFDRIKSGSVYYIGLRLMAED